MEDKIVVYTTFQDPVEANIVMARLKDAGFNCFLTGENTALVYPVFDNSISGVQLHVFENEVEAINALLAEDSEL
ncbi:MAG: putative signal transducing protein [Bacteroidia bacterium]